MVVNDGHVGGRYHVAGEVAAVQGRDGLGRGFDAAALDVNVTLGLLVDEAVQDVAVTRALLDYVVRDFLVPVDAVLFLRVEHVGKLEAGGCDRGCRRRLGRTAGWSRQAQAHGLPEDQGMLRGSGDLQAGPFGQLGHQLQSAGGTKIDARPLHGVIVQKRGSASERTESGQVHCVSDRAQFDWLAGNFEAVQLVQGAFRALGFVERDECVPLRYARVLVLDDLHLIDSAERREDAF